MTDINVGSISKSIVYIKKCKTILNVQTNESQYELLLFVVFLLVNHIFFVENYDKLKDISYV